MSYQLRVASFNIASALQPNIQEINLLLKDFQIDFVGLQEVDWHTKRNLLNMMEIFINLKEFSFRSFLNQLILKMGIMV
ncbi:MAG: endonuclease/exonuclease/phosphatase family protein [Beduini sp.]